MSKVSVLADLRVILRYLKTLPSDGSNCFRASIMAQYRAHKEADKEGVRDLRLKAHDAAQLVAVLRERKELLELHAGEKMTQEERIKLSAARVGLNIPLMYQEGSGTGAHIVEDAHAARTS